MKRKGYFPALIVARLDIKVETWHRDSHGLYDYETKSLVHKLIKTSNRGILVRDEDSVSFLHKESVETTTLPSSSEILAKITTKDTAASSKPVWYIENPARLTPLKSGKDNRIWIAIRANTSAIDHVRLFFSC